MPLTIRRVPIALDSRRNSWHTSNGMNRKPQHDLSAQPCAVSPYRTIHAKRAGLDQPAEKGTSCPL